MAAKKGTKKEPVEHGPPMATRLGMSEDWAITGWDMAEKAWAHFLCLKRKTTKATAKPVYDLLEVIDGELQPCTFEDDEKPIKVKSVDEAVEIVDDALSPEDDEEEDEDE